MSNIHVYNNITGTSLHLAPGERFYNLYLNCYNDLDLSALYQVDSKVRNVKRLEDLESAYKKLRETENEMNSLYIERHTQLQKFIDYQVSIDKKLIGMQQVKNNLWNVIKENINEIERDRHE
ncbi:MAG: hypothetical protein IJ134_00480 [Bacilli bacterium]|nr:hypothetical protein [Bacilli bacterium]